MDGFAGALPESQIREFVKKLTGGAAGESPVAEALEAAESMLNEENYDAASGLFKQILQHDPSSARGLAGLCKSLIALNNLDEAKELIMERGDKFHVYRGLRHQMFAIEDSDLFEFSTQHFDSDSNRIIHGD